MPPPNSGRGNAWSRTDVNEKWLEITRKAARDVASRATQLDNEGESVILNIIRSAAALGTKRRDAAVLELRAALKLARKGHDPREDLAIGKCLNPYCDPRGSARSHTFFCRRSGSGTKHDKVELDLKAAVWAALDEYVTDCRRALVIAVRTSAPVTVRRARARLAFVSHAAAVA